MDRLTFVLVGGGTFRCGFVGYPGHLTNIHQKELERVADMKREARQGKRAFKIIVDRLKNFEVGSQQQIACLQRAFSYCFSARENGLKGVASKEKAAYVEMLANKLGYTGSDLQSFTEAATGAL